MTELGIEWEPGASTDKIARVVQVMPAAEAFAKNKEEMLLGMLSMSPGARVADVDRLRVRLGWQACADEPGGPSRAANPTKKRPGPLTL